MASRVKLGCSICVLVVVGLCSSLVAYFCIAFPTPPRITSVQQEVLKVKTAEAKAASDAATPELLEFLDSADFRASVQHCCPETAKMSAQELLDRLRSEAQIAELGHGFPSSAGGISSLQFLVSAFGYFVNDWHAMLLVAPFDPTMDKSEVGFFGCHPFAATRPTWAEASDRLMYVAHNMRRVDAAAAPNFGDIVVVMRHKNLRETVLINPTDTGTWEQKCNTSGGTIITNDNSGHKVEMTVGDDSTVNCSVWPSGSPVGTLDHLDHIILPSLRFWAGKSSKTSVFDEAEELFARSAFGGDYTKIPHTNLYSVNKYWEADIMANPRLDTDVNFAVAAFGSLFGTDEGRRTQEIAKQLAWPLVWSFGSGSTEMLDHTTATFPGNRRILDPLVASTNATARDGAAAVFAQCWAEAEKARAKGNVDMESLWQCVEAEQLRLAPLTTTSCAEPIDCIGTDTGTGDCICRVRFVQSQTVFAQYGLEGFVVALLLAASSIWVCAKELRTASPRAALDEPLLS